jgi:hypothetical protein
MGQVDGVTKESLESAEAVLGRLRLAAKSASDAQLAEAMGLSRSAVSTARTRGVVPAAWIVNAASLFSVSADFLIFGKEPRAPAPPEKGEAAKAASYVRRALSEVRDTLDSLDAAGGGHAEAPPSLRFQSGGREAPVGPPSAGAGAPFGTGPEERGRSTEDGGRPEGIFTFEGEGSGGGKATKEAAFPESEAELEAMEEDGFMELWEAFRTVSRARRGWAQVELVSRFPEFVAWLKWRRG